MSRIEIYHYIIALGMLIGFIRFKRLKPVLKTLPCFLLLTLFVECANAFHLLPFLHYSNHWYFNIFSTVEFLYYSFIFYQILEKTPLKKMIATIVVIFFVFTCINIFFIGSFYRFNTISYRAGAVMVVVWCLLYFRQLMQSTEQIILARNPFFWISTGLLFFYLGFFFIFCAFDYIAYKNIKYNGELWNIISDTLNFLLYSCFVIALICQEKSRQ